MHVGNSEVKLTHIWRWLDKQNEHFHEFKYMLVFIEQQVVTMTLCEWTSDYRILRCIFLHNLYSEFVPFGFLILVAFFFSLVSYG